MERKREPLKMRKKLGTKFMCETKTNSRRDKNLRIRENSFNYRDKNNARSDQNDRPEFILLKENRDRRKKVRQRLCEQNIVDDNF
jgi:hypothetical protein